MDERYGILNQILGDLNRIADSTGIARCIIIAKVYDQIKSLVGKMQEEDERVKEDISRLNEEILGLKEKQGE